MDALSLRESVTGAMKFGSRAEWLQSRGTFLAIGLAFIGIITRFFSMGLFHYPRT
jgi:hypothetical protein